MENHPIIGEGSLVVFHLVLLELTLASSLLLIKDAGYYQCVATNGSGSTKSEYAKLTLAGTYVQYTCRSAVIV